jgi:hypothetical protein
MLQVSPLSDHKETPPPTKLTTQLDWIVNTAGFIGPGVVTNGQITAMSFTGTDAVLFGVHFGCGGSGPCELVWLFSGDATAQETDDFCSCRLINYLNWNSGRLPQGGFSIRAAGVLNGF